MFLMCQISTISIAGFVILGLFVLLGLWKGFIRMLLTVLVVGLSLAAGALGVEPIRNALAAQDYFGQEWLEGILSGSLAFIAVFFVALIILSVIKAIIMHFVNKKGGKIKGALNIVNHLVGAVVGAGLGFLAFGFVLYCYVSIVAVLNYDGDVTQVVELSPLQLTRRAITEDGLSLRHGTSFPLTYFGGMQVFPLTRAVEVVYTSQNEKDRKSAQTIYDESYTFMTENNGRNWDAILTLAGVK